MELHHTQKCRKEQIKNLLELIKDKIEIEKLKAQFSFNFGVSPSKTDEYLNELISLGYVKKEGEFVLNAKIKQG